MDDILIGTVYDLRTSRPRGITFFFLGSDMLMLKYIIEYGYKFPVTSLNEFLIQITDKCYLTYF
jgi:hypothetical protein